MTRSFAKKVLQLVREKYGGPVGERLGPTLAAEQAGTLLRPNNILRHHYPLLDRLKIPRGGFQAFRHASASFMDQLNAPMVIRQKRLGPADVSTTMKCTRSVSEEERRASEQLGRLRLSPWGSCHEPQRWWVYTVHHGVCD